MLTIKGELGVEEFYSIIFRDETIEVHEDVIDTVQKSFDFLKQFSENKVIYGVNTGFGPMAQYKIEDAQRIQLQYNLIRSHASGTGNPIAPKYVRAAMLARMNTSLWEILAYMYR